MVDTEIFLSTDGKHTVHVKTNGDIDPEAALEIAEELYAKIESKYGRKVDQWKELNAKPGPTKPTPGPVSPDAPVCGVHGSPMRWKAGGISKTTGKPYNGFWSCSERNEDGSFCRYKPTQTRE